MPLYDYSCSSCSKVIEVLHSMSEVDNPSVATIKEITCHCKKRGVRMQRAFITAPSVKTPTRNEFLNRSRKKRNKDHFKNEVLPTITDQTAKKHHLSKMGKT